MATPEALAIVGPTSSGKTALSIEVARRLGGEIISMDSMALYRRMDLGTAKPTIPERQAVRHHLIDVLDPWESASAAWWRSKALRAPPRPICAATESGSSTKRRS